MNIHNIHVCQIRVFKKISEYILFSNKHCHIDWTMVSKNGFYHSFPVGIEGSGGIAVAGCTGLCLCNCKHCWTQIGRIIATYKSIVIFEHRGSTCFNSRSGTLSAINLSVLSRPLVRLSWRVLVDLHRSDHFPLLITASAPEGKCAY